MKQFGILKVAYSTGDYGNTGEYFVCIYTGKEGLKQFSFRGQYGVESRIAAAMIQKKYKQTHLYNGLYGKVALKDVPTGLFKDEKQTLEYIDSNFKQNANK